MAPLIMSLGRSPPIAQDAERKAMDLAQLLPARCDGAGKGMTKGVVGQFDCGSRLAAHT